MIYATTSTCICICMYDMCIYASIFIKFSAIHMIK